MNRQSLAEYIEGFRHSGRDVAHGHRRGYRAVRWTYLRIAETAAQAAREFERLGAGKGDRVAIWGEDCGEWVAAFHGCVLGGQVAVPIDRFASANFARRILREARVRIVVGSREKLRELIGAPSLAFIAFEDFADVLGAHSTEPYASPPLGPTDVLEILFTSGATAEPKGVVITHGNVLANLAPIESGIAKYLRYERLVHPIRFLSLLPLSHVFGQFMGMFVPALLRGTVLFAETPAPAEIARTIRRERVSVLVAVPRMIESLKDWIERDYETRGALDGLRTGMKAAEGLRFTSRWWRFRRVHAAFGWKFWAFVSGGAALDGTVEAFWNRLGFAVVQGYGMTETTSLVSLNHPFGVRRGSIGKVLPGRELKVDENGEILVRGAGVAGAYWQDGSPRAATDAEGWLRTGDLGAMDAQGNLYFKGRKKNVIVTPEGMNVYPQDLETVLRADPAVRDCVVLPIPRGANAVPGVALLPRDRHADAAAIIDRANRSLAEYQRIREWFVWPEEDFPRTATEKPRMNVLLDAMLGRTVASGGNGSVAALVAQVARRPSDDLASLSSLERVELMSAMEERFHVDLAEPQFTAAATVADLEAMLRASSGESSGKKTEYHYPRWVQRRLAAWIRPAVYRLLAWPITQLLAMPTIRGRERLRGLNGPVLVVANHIAYFDIGLVLAALPARLRRAAVAMEGERVQRMRRPPKDWPLRERVAARLAYWMMTAVFHVFPLPQRAGFRESFRFAGEAADKGYGVVVFPEGRRTPDGAIHPFRPGIGLLAANLGLPVVPMRIHGLWELKASGRRGCAPWGAIRVQIGDPLRFPADADPREIARALECAVRSL